MTCKIASHFILHDADISWFKNGFEKLKFRRVQNEADGNSLLQSTTIELISSSNDSYSHQGYYQCIIFAPRFMKEEVRSSKLQVQFQGNFLCIEIYLVKAIVGHNGRIFFYPVTVQSAKPGGDQKNSQQLISNKKNVLVFILKKMVSKVDALQVSE